MSNPQGPHLDLQVQVEHEPRYHFQAKWIFMGDDKLAAVPLSIDEVHAKELIRRGNQHDKLVRALKACEEDRQRLQGDSLEPIRDAIAIQVEQALSGETL